MIPFEPYELKDILRTFIISRTAYYDFLGLIHRYIGMERGRSQKKVLEEVVDVLKSAGYYMSYSHLNLDYTTYKKLIGMGIKHKRLYKVNPWVFRALKKYAETVNDKEAVEAVIDRLRYNEPGVAMKLLEREMQIHKAKKAGLIGDEK